VRLRFFPALLCILLLAAPLIAQERVITIGEAAENALRQSQLTRPGSAAFHLKAQISNTANPSSDYKAEVEEFWLSPEHWRRTIRSPQFSQTVVMDGDKLLEQNDADYYPFWLRNLVTALFDPLPMHEQLQQFRGTLELAGDSPQSQSCLQFSSPSGVAPARGSVNYAFCFQGKLGLLQNVVTPGYKARFEEYKPFKNKMVARRIVAEMEPHTVLEARITELDDILPRDRTLLTVEQSTPADGQLRSMQVGEGLARSLALATPALTWPPVREGKNAGTLILYISTDKMGRVREAWPIASDNPELTPAARDQVQQWRFKPYVNGTPAQMEAVLTFAFDAMMGAPIPLLSNAEARRLATHVTEPRLASGKAAPGTKWTMRIRVDEQGHLLRVLNLKNAKPALATAAERALKQWQFRPYQHDGKADLFDADIVFTVR
jgi:hypothetical protein